MVLSIHSDPCTNSCLVLSLSLSLSLFLSLVFLQSLDTGEQGHSTGYATDPHRKPLNRFGNIIVCE